jgi:Rieske Fe-S protein
MGRPTLLLGRRRFLVLAGAGAAGCWSAPVPPANVGDVPAGNVAGLPVGSLRPVAGQPVCIGRDARGVYAMTLTCTHAGCDMGEAGTVSPQGLDCACHGSRFDANGNVVSGPATAPLDHFAVSVDVGGNMTILGGQVVDAAQRLVVHV